MRALFLATAIFATGCFPTARNEFPTEAQVKEKIRIGMTHDEILAMFGEPLVRQPEGHDAEAMLYAPPEAQRTRPEVGYTGFEVRLKDGRVQEFVIVTGSPAYAPD